MISNKWTIEEVIKGIKAITGIKSYEKMIHWHKMTLAQIFVMRIQNDSAPYFHHCNSIANGNIL